MTEDLVQLDTLLKQAHLKAKKIGDNLQKEVPDDILKDLDKWLNSNEYLVFKTATLIEQQTAAALDTINLMKPYIEGVG